MAITGKLNIEIELMTIGTYDREPGQHWSEGVRSGEWSYEPFDYGTWVDNQTGYTCAIKRNSSGSWCGYVYAGDDHPIHGEGNNLEHGEPVWLDVHGGVTWHREMEVPDVSVSGKAIGFDCAHHSDLSPRDTIRSRGYGEYRTARFTIEETRSLARQVAAYRPLQQIAV
jgi:hypothetical protein